MALQGNGENTRNCAVGGGPIPYFRRLLLCLMTWLAIATIGMYVTLKSTARYPGTCAGVIGKGDMSGPCLSKAEKHILEKKLAYAENHRKIIMAWDGEKYKATYIRPAAAVLTRECGSCVVTTNNTLMRSEDIASVVINYQSVAKRHLPSKKFRKPNQVYVLQVGEPPPLMKKLGRFKSYKSINRMHFNATMMVWRDSSIYGPFGSAWKSRQNGRRLLRQRFGDDIKNVSTSKTKFAIAIVSNCKVGGAKIRLALVKMLMDRGLDLDTYGRCFKNELPRSDDKLHSSDIIFPYKFYLSFENTFHCKDYITEKFFSNALSNFAVPVVWGATREDYEAVAPPNSFIHVDDFKSAEELIGHLNYLDRNDEAYLQYFRWIHMPRHHFPHHNRKYGYCQLCRILHGINVDDAYSPSFNASHHIPLLSEKVYPRTIPKFQELVDSIEPEECFWSNDEFRNASTDSIASRAYEVT